MPMTLSFFEIEYVLVQTFSSSDFSDQLLYIQNPFWLFVFFQEVSSHSDFLSVVLISVKIFSCSGGNSLINVAMLESFSLNI